MTNDTPTVPCTLCGTPTPMTATKLCTRCWELSRRIRRDPELARQLVNAHEAPNAKPTIWLLTEEHNDYDQHGEYFVAWWPEFPTFEQLRMALEGWGLSDTTLAHIKTGGGRCDAENVWWNLRREEAAS
jgi:hypothetical protein